MRVIAPKAKSRLASRCAQAKRRPVFVEKASRAAGKKAFESDFSDWIADQNERVETQGIPGFQLRPW